MAGRATAAQVIIVHGRQVIVHQRIDVNQLNGARRRFDIILANLVGNALRHGALPVTVTAGLQPDGQGGTRLTVAVRDHGDGLAPHAIPHLFDRFYKADTARARSEGSGLGLAIAWENARLHGGHIDAGNHPDGGAIFTVSLPVNGHAVAVSGQMVQLTG